MTSANAQDNHRRPVIEGGKIGLDPGGAGVLAFSRRQIIEPRVLNLNDLVGDLRRMLGRLIGEDIELRFSMAADRSRPWRSAGASTMSPVLEPSAAWSGRRKSSNWIPIGMNKKSRKSYRP